MRKEAWLVSAVVVVGAAVPLGAMVWTARPIHDRVIHAGSALIAVEGRPYWDFPWTERYSAGVGIDGTVVLTDDGCIALRQTFQGASHDLMVVWPQGTTVSGSGRDLEIHVGSRRIRVGDLQSGGSEQRQKFSGVDGHLPKGCARLPIIDFGPGT